MDSWSFEKIGRITEGDEKGRYIKIIEDSERTGGIYIYFSPNIRFTHVFDDWVENIDSLKLYLASTDWIVDWDPPANSPDLIITDESRRGLPTGDGLE